VDTLKNGGASSRRNISMKRMLWTAVPSLPLLVTLVAVAFPTGVGAAERFPKQINYIWG
jgi:hypothetical protein